jgi:AraC-like DNA-binding protein
LKGGSLAGLRDPIVDKALGLIHAKPAFSWTIDRLARQCAASRTVLTERFTQFVGMPPIHYLAKWWMQVASGMLNRGNASMAMIAAEIGYESEAAFSRPFKKMMGVPPSAWRLGARGYSRRASRGSLRGLICRAAFHTIALISVRSHVAWFPATVAE